MKRQFALSLLVALTVAPVAAFSQNEPARPYPEVRADVDSLWQKDVAWRQLNWQACLIRGINTARQQGKPLMVWMFIDRPIDDERC